MGTKFTVYDNGMNPVKTTSTLEASNLRQELAAICYVSKLFLAMHGCLESRLRMKGRCSQNSSFLADIAVWLGSLDLRLETQ